MSTYKNVLKPGSQYLESNCDEQVMDGLWIDKWMNKQTYGLGMDKYG